MRKYASVVDENQINILLYPKTKTKFGQLGHGGTGENPIILS
jgi:hypothetical protein